MKTMREIMRIVEGRSETTEIGEIGEMEVPIYDGHGKVIRTAKVSNETMFTLARTFQALKRKRSPEAKEMVRKLGLWGDHLQDQQRQAEQTHASSWRDRLDNCVWSRGDGSGGYAITVNDLNRATYIILWFEGKRVGTISTRTHQIGKEEFTGIGKAEIDKPHRGKGLGRQMYIQLLQHCGTAGIASYTPDRSNSTTVPTIYQRLGGKQVGDYAIIRRQEATS